MQVMLETLKEVAPNVLEVILDVALICFIVLGLPALTLTALGNTRTIFQEDTCARMRKVAIVLYIALLVSAVVLTVLTIICTNNF